MPRGARYLINVITFIGLFSPLYTIEGMELNRSKRYLIYPDGDPARVQLIIGLGIPVDLEQQAVTVGYVIKIQYHLPLNSTEYTDPIYNYASQVLARRIDEDGNKITGGDDSTETGITNIDQSAKSIKIDDHDELYNNATYDYYENDNSTSIEETDDTTTVDNHDVTTQNIDYSIDTAESKKNMTLLEAIEAEEAEQQGNQPVRRRRSRWDMYKIIEVLAEHYGMNSGRACLLKTICESADTPFTHRNGLLGELAHVLFTPSTTNELLSHHTDNEYHAAEMIGKRRVGNCDALFPDCPSSILDYFTQINFMSV